MPARKRTSKTTRKSYKKQRVVSRPKPIASMVHAFRRNANLLSLTGSAGFAPYCNSFAFQLANLPNNSDFTNLFDEYMISHVQLRFYLSVDPSAQAAASAYQPRMWYIRDHNDATAPATLDELRERGDVKTRVLTVARPVTINIKPSVLAETVRVGGLTTQSPRYRTWLPCANNDVPHYGFKWAFDDLTNTNYKVNVEATYWVRCKTTR